MKRDSFVLQILKGFGWFVFAYVICFILCSSIIFAKHFLINIVLEVFEMSIILILMGNYAWKDGKKEIKLTERYKLEPVSKFRWYAIGFLSSLPIYIMLLLLILDKCGIIMGFARWYKMLSPYFLPVTSWLVEKSGVFVCGADFSWKVIALLGILSLTVPITTGVCHSLSYKDKISGDTIMYEDIKQ